MKKCIECSQEFDTSFLHKNFSYRCCDNCREPDGKHDLITRTDAKREFGVTEEDLYRKPKLRCIKKLNYWKTTMQLYLKIQVEQRAAEKVELMEAMKLAKEILKEKKKNESKQVKRLQKQKQKDT